MYKKSFILVSVILFVLCIFSGFVCATNNVKNAVSGTTNTMIDGAARLGNDVRSGVGAVENGIENMFDMDDHSENATGTTNDNNTTGNVTTRANDNAGTYTTTRTTADATGMTDNTSTLWIWLVVAIAAIVIIGLVWYYGAQNPTHRGE